MRRYLTPLLALLAGILLGYLLGLQMASDDPAPDPPAPAAVQEEVERYRIENQDLRAKLSARPTPVAPIAAELEPTGPEPSRPVPVTPFPVAPDGTENPVRVAGESEDPEKGGLRVFVTGRRGEPLSGVEVKVKFYGGGGSSTGHDGRTDSDGWATFRKLPPARYTAAASFPSASKATTGPERFDYRTTHAQVVPGRITEVSLPRGTSGTLVTGRVTDPDGKGYKDALVSLFRTETFFMDSFYARTDEGGRYRIENVPAGRYEMKARGGGVPYKRDPDAVVRISGSGTLTKDIVVGDPAAAAPSLTGVVREAGTLKPIGGVRLAVQGGAYQVAVTNAEGVYRIVNLSPGNYRLTVTKPEYAFLWLRDVKVTAGGEELDVELSPAAVLHLTVTGPDGNPATGKLHLGFIPKTEAGQRLGTSVETDGEGKAVYRQGMPGDYELRFSIDGVGSTKATRTLVVGEQKIGVRLE